MRITASILFVILVILRIPVAGQSVNRSLIPPFSPDDDFEISIRFSCSDSETLDKIGKIISIDHKTHVPEIVAFANRKGMEQFLGYHIPYEIVVPEYREILMRDEVIIGGVNDWDYYPTYDAYISMMNQFQQLYPQLCKVFSIGTSIEGRSLMFAKITDNPGITEGDEPRFLFVSTIHGNETTGFVLLLRLIDYLLENYSSNPDIKELIDNTEIWINPNANPDGTYAGGNITVNGATRFNANWIDLNRNFPDPEDGPHPDGNPWQKETLEYMDLADSVHFVAGVNIHGGTEVCNYPWDTWSKLHADNAWWISVCRRYADTVHEYCTPGYLDDFNNGITNGYAWYEIDGGRQDFMNYFSQCREFTLEISNDYSPPQSYLPTLWEFNYRSFLHLAGEIRYGFHGMISDSATGEPVHALITLTGHDADSSMVFSDPASGVWFRPVSAGTYNLVFSAPGYKTRSLNNVAIQEFQALTLDVLMAKGNNGEPEYAGDPFTILTRQENRTILILPGIPAFTGNVTILDISGRTVWEEKVYFRPGHTAHIDIAFLKPGMYFIQVSSRAFSKTAKFFVRS